MSPVPPRIVEMSGFHDLEPGDSLRLRAQIEHWDTSEVRYLRSSCGWLRFRATQVAVGYYYVWVYADRDTTHVGCCDLYFADSLGQSDTAASQVCVVRGTGIVEGRGQGIGDRGQGASRALRVHPSPASGLVRVDDLLAEEPVRVTDVLGRRVSVARPSANELDLRALPNGVYTIRTSDALGHVTVLH